MRMQAGEVAAAVGGSLVGVNVEIDGVTIDSRAVHGHPLFVPVVAERDGHDFIGDAVAAGSVAYLTSRDDQLPSEGEATAIVVSDTTAALLDIGRVARRHLPERVVGITGSVGKTSTKDLLVGVLSGTFRTAASERSFNNELGVPLTLANAADDVEAVVVEMGARGVGHIALLCDVASPTIGVITAVGAAHLEQFGSIEQVAEAKGELIESLPVSGTAVLNLDDPLVAAMASRSRASVLGFGIVNGDVRAEKVRVDEELRASFTLVTAWGSVEVAMAVHGRHQVGNALAAAAAGLACGTPLDGVAAGLAGASISALRMDLVRTATGLTILNDAYNANPTSVRAALRSLVEIPARRRVAVLGPMAELGMRSPALHREIADEAASRGVRLVSVGAPEYGVTGDDAVDSVVAAAERLGDLQEGDAVLVKASRVARLERLVDLLGGPA